MKIRILTIIVSLVTMYVSVSAQSIRATPEEPAKAPGAESANPDIFPMSVGAYIGGRACVNAGEIPTGTKTGLSMNGVPDFGATFYVPFTTTGSSNIGFNLAFGYTSLTVVSKPESGVTDGTTLVPKLSYFAITPTFYLKGISVGVNIGMPTGLTYFNKDETIKAPGQKDLLNTLVSFHFGGIIPIYYDEFGRFNFLISGSYPLGDVGKIYGNDYAPVPASLSLGVSYVVNLMGN